jgi:hypothetical protein
MALTRAIFGPGNNSQVSIKADIRSAVSQSDTITLLESGLGLTNSSLRGDDTEFKAVDFKGGSFLGPNTGFLVNSGTNSSDLEISTIIEELKLGDAANPLTANDSLFYLTDNGTDSRLFKFLDQNGNADVDDGEATAIATFEGVSNAIVITDDFVIDFAASGGSGF